MFLSTDIEKQTRTVKITEIQMQLRINCASGYCSSLPSGQMSQSEYSGVSHIPNLQKDPLTDKEMKIIGDLCSHQLWPVQ